MQEDDSFIIALIVVIASMLGGTFIYLIFNNSKFALFTTLASIMLSVLAIALLLEMEDEDE